MISARRTNTAIAVVVALLLVITIVVAVFGTPTSAPTINDATGTTVPVASSIPDDADVSPPTGGLTRDADRSDSWFSHTFAIEQFDFPMDELSCDEMEQYLTMELCVVAQTPRGNFMVTATEGFWDPQSNNDAPVEIPLNFMVYVHTTENGPPRAMSVLDGFITAPYGPASSQVQVSTFNVASENIVVLEWSSADDATRKAERTWSVVQVLAMRSGGLPEVVATYGGTDITYGSDSRSLILTSERFGPPSRDEEAEPWLTVLHLSPSITSQWRETVSSQAVASFDRSSLNEALERSTYEFPKRRTETAPVS